VKTGAVVYFFIFAVYASLTACLGSRAGVVSSALAALENSSTGSRDAHRRSERVGGDKSFVSPVSDEGGLYQESEG